MPVPNSFANVTTSIPLSQLDANFNTPITLGNTAIQLGNTVTTLNNMTLANVTISSGNVTITNVTVTTANVATANVTTSQILNYGTANQVQYLNASKALTGSANLTFDGTTFTHTGASNFATSTGNVGIGTSSPGYTASGRTVLQVNGSSQSIISLAYGGTNAWYAYADSSNTILYSEGSRNLTVGTVGAGNYVFATNNAEKMRLDSSGNLGLGVTPSAWRTSGDRALQIGSWMTLFTDSGVTAELASNTYVSSASQYVYANNGFATRYRQYLGQHAWFTAASGTAGNAITFTQAMTLNASGYLGLGETNPVADIDISKASGDVITRYRNGTGTGIVGVRSDNAFTEVRAVSNHGIQFSTNNTERARITSGGYFKASNAGTYYGTTGSYHELRTNLAGEVVAVLSHNSASNPYGQYIEFSGADPNNATNYVLGAWAATASTWMYRIFSNGTVAARSDVKWKKNIETARNGYAEDLAKLRVVKYNWYNHEDGTPKELGLIAQEVEQVFPGLVITDEQTRNEVKTREVPAVLDEEGNEVEPARTEEYTEKVGTGEYSKSIKFSVLPIMLLKAIQEQQAMIEELKSEIAALKAQP